MMQTNDYLLSAAWAKFCNDLKAAGDIALRHGSAGNPVDRAAGYRLLSRNIALALAFELENKDPRYPELMHYFDPVRKQGGDNADALYVGAPINGRDVYRIIGRRGTARFFSVSVVERGETPWGGAVPSMLFGDDLIVEEDGTFVLWLSPEPQSGNWLRTTPNTFRVTVRQFFADWEGEIPMTARIERATDDGPPPHLSPDLLIEGLAAASDWLSRSVTYWADMLDRWKQRPNLFLSYRQVETNNIDSAPGGEPLISYWMLSAHEALIVRVTPPRAQYWSVEFGNCWWETMDYRYRLTSTNCHQAALEDDGELILVVSHDDPGLPNWLDPSGHSEGYITFRWMRAESWPVPTVQQVKREDLLGHLPAGVRTITPAGRREQLAGRHRGIACRFSW